MKEEIDSHEKRESIDFLTEVFAPLPDLKPEMLNEYDFCLFNLMISIARCPTTYSIVDSFFLAFHIIEAFISTCLPELCKNLYSIDENSQNDVLTKVFTFLITFSNVKNYPDPLYLYAFNVVYLLCILSFFGGLYLMHRRVSLPYSLQMLFYLFVMAIPPLMIYISSVRVTYCFANVIINGFTDTFYISLMTFVLYAGVFFIRIQVLNTTFGSFYYRCGMFILFNLYTIEILYFFTLSIFHGANMSLGFTKARIFICSLYIAAGVFYLLSGVFYFALMNQMNAFIQSYGMSLISSGIMGLIDTYGYFEKSQLSLIINFWVFVLFYFFFKMKQDSKDRQNSLVLKNCRNFEELPIKNYIDLLSFFKAGISTNLQFIYDGSFFIWGFHKFNNSWVLMDIIRISSLIPQNDKLDELVFSFFPAFNNETQNDRFILYENYSIRNLRRVELPENIKPKIKAITKQMNQYKLVSKLFSNSFSDNTNSSFVFFEALAKTRSNLLGYIKMLYETFPNSPEIMKLLSQYYKKIEKDTIKSTLLRNQAISIEKEYMGLTDYTFLKVGAYFPTAQKLLYSSLKQNVTKTVIADEPAHQYSSSFKEKRNNLFIIFSTLYALLIISVCVYYNGFIGISYKNLNDYNASITLINEYAKTTESLGTFSLMSLQLLLGLKADDTNNSFYDSYTYEIQQLLEIFTLGRSDAIFNEQFLWLENQAYILTTFNGDYVQASFRSVMSRISDTFITLYQTHDNNRESFEYLFYISICEASDAFYESVQYLETSYEGMSDKIVSNQMVYLAYLIIPLLFFSIILVFIPFVYQKYYVKLSKTYCKNSKKTKNIENSLIKIFLEKKYPSFRRLTVSYITFILLLIIFALLYFIFALFCLWMYKSNHYNHVDRILLFIQHTIVMYTSAAVSILSTVLDTTNEYNAQKLYNISMRNHEYFGNMIIPLSDYSDALYTYSVMFQGVSQNNVVSYNSSITGQMIYLYENYLLPTLTLYREATYSEAPRTANKYLSNITSINLAVFLISGFLLTCILLVSYTIDQSLKAAIQHLSSISNTPTTYSDMTITHHSGSILDFINFPAAVVDGNKIISHINQLWIAKFKIQPDFIIGQNVDEFLTDMPKEKIQIYQMPELNELYILEISKANEKLDNKLTTIEGKIEQVRLSIIPQIFLDKEPGVYKIGFIVAISFAVEPIKFDEISSEEWGNDLDTIIHKAYDYCKKCDDVNLAQVSGREMTILFGLKNQYLDDYIVANAVLFMTEMLRFANENEWRGGGFSTVAIISCDRHSKFVIQRSQTTTIDMFGPVFSKQMTLRKYTEPNSITCCKRTMHYLKKFNKSLEFEKVGKGAYQFFIEGADDHSSNQFKSLHGTSGYL